MDVMKYLLIESSVPSITKERKPKPVKSESITKTVAGLGAGYAATTERFGVGKSIKALHQGTKARVLPTLVSKLGRLSKTGVGKAIAKGGAWTAGAGLAYGLADTLAFGAGNTVGRGLAGAGEKIRGMFKKKPKTKIGMPRA
jgi:hypothetical protein